MEYLEIVSIPVIATIVYWVMNMLKTLTKNNETFKRFIPLASGGLGAVLGIILYYALPGTIAASNVLVAIMSGAASGLTATGCNQIFKQLCDDKTALPNKETTKESVEDKENKTQTDAIAKVEETKKEEENKSETK